MKILFIALLGLIQTPALAAPVEGGQEGNGGDVVVCPGRGVELLDFYEARTLRNIKIEPRGEADYRVILAELLAANRPSFPGLVEKLELEIAKFHEESLFLSGVNLTDIPDSRHIALPAGCTIEQIAIQRAPIYPQDKRYTVSVDLWNQLSPLDKAGLVLHEVLYKHGLEGGISHSMDVRYLNSIFFAGIFANLNDRDRFQILFNSRQPIFDVVRNGAWLSFPVYETTQSCSDFNGGCRNVAVPLILSFDAENRISNARAGLGREGAPYGGLRFEKGPRFSFRVNEVGEFSWKKGRMTLSRSQHGYGFELKAIYEGYPFTLKRIAKMDAEKICYEPVSSIDRFFSSAHLEFSLEKSECIRTESLLELAKAKVAFASLQGLKNVSYKLPEDLSLSDFLPAGAGRWEVLGAPAGFTYVQSSLSVKGATVRWHHPLGTLEFPPRSSIPLTPSGDIMARSPYGNASFTGTWKTAAGFDFVGKFTLRADYTFEQGTSEQPVSFKNAHLELKYHQLQENNGITWFKRLTAGGWLQLQGKKLALGSWGHLAIFSSGAPAYFVLEESVKLKNSLGKEKLYKGSVKNPLAIYLTEEGLVKEGN